MEQLDFYSEEENKKKVAETLKKLDVQAPEIATILRRHIEPEDQSPHIKEGVVEESKPKREPWGVGAAIPDKDL